MSAIAALREGPMNISELSLQLKLTPSSILHSIKEIVEDGTIEKHGGRYSLSSTGKIKAALIDSMGQSLAVLEANKAFWPGHDVSGIPDNMLARIGELRGCTCIEDDDEIVMKSLAYAIEQTSKARHVWGISPVIAPGHQEMVLGLLANGAEVNLILTKSIIKGIDPGLLCGLLALPNFHLYEVEDDLLSLGLYGVRLTLTVADDMLSLGLYLPGGAYDTNHDLVCQGEEAAGWGRDLFEHYREQAKEVV